MRKVAKNKGVVVMKLGDGKFWKGKITQKKKFMENCRKYKYFPNFETILQHLTY